VLIAGPTASGKSAYALRLAEARDGVIINADAMQVYRELRILTARPGIADEARVPHRLYGHVSGTDVYSVARWLADAAAAIAAVWADGRLPIVVGGTGLYFRALQEGLADVPPIPAAVRDKWRNFPGDLAQELARRDPLSASRLRPGDRQRLARALEVIEATGKPLRYWQREARGRAVLTGVATERLYLDLPREVLYQRADARLDRMIAEGAIDEVRPLIGMASDLPMMQAIGVPEIRRYLLGEVDLAGAVRQAKTATRHYIKRQLTWWRHQMPGWDSLVAGDDM
jgi:tRNA dimethylallyltransferase